ncbi:MAG: hypothetical protein HRT47_13935 [Candidatus Caenarcaniphilales bacterium]|nr:hypothetical protein [Candidatus Caenarcaniphilales bacterium]
MEGIVEESVFECRELYFEEFEAALAFIAGFHADLGIFRELGLDTEDMKKYFKPRLGEALNKELVLGVFQDDKILAVAIADDNSDKNFDFADKQKILKKLQYHSLIMKKAYDNPVMDVLKEDKVKFFHLAFMAFNKEKIEESMMIELLSEHLDIAGRMSYDYLLVDCYSSIPRKTLSMIDFIRVNSFKLNNQVGFKDLDDEEKLDIWLKEI